MKKFAIFPPSRLPSAWPGLVVLASTLFLSACGLSGGALPGAERTHLQYVQDKYAKAVAAATKRPSYVGLTSNLSSATVNGRVVREDRVFVGNTDVTYVTFSFANNTVLTTGSLDSNIGAALTEVWRKRSDSFCRVLTTQSNGDPMLPFSVASAAAWIKQDSNNQITYRLYVGTSEGVVGKISFVDQNPLDDCQSIGNEAGQGHFTVISHGQVVAPVNSLKLTDIQETAPDFAQNKPVLQFGGKRVLYWWGSTTDCRPLDGSTSCSNWSAIAASAALLADDEPQWGATTGVPIPDLAINVDPDASGGLARFRNTQVHDMDLRAQFNKTNSTLQLAIGVVYQSPPDTGASTAGLDLTQLPNIHTYSNRFVLDSSSLFSGAASALAASGRHSERWSYAAAPGTYDSNTPRYSPYTKLRIFDLDNDPSQTSVALTTYGEGNQASYCPISVQSWRDCASLAGASGANRTVVTTLEVDGAYKGWGLESMGLMAQSVSGFFGSNRASVVLAPMQGNAFNPVGSNWKGLLKDFSITEFQSVFPDDNGNNISGLADVGDIRALLVPDSSDLRFARLFVLVQANNNSAYNPVVDGSGASMVNGGLMMCTARLDLATYFPAAFGVPGGGQAATTTAFARQLDCSAQWQSGSDAGYKIASAKNILLDRNYQSSPRFFNLHWVPLKNEVHVSYISLNGAISQIYASDPNQAWSGQTSWTNISQGRSASCNNFLVKPPVPPTPPKQNVPFWKRALTTAISLGRYSGGDFTTAFEKGFSARAELLCEAFEGPAGVACGVVAAAVLDQTMDAVDSKVRKASEASSDPDYKKLFDATAIQTACHVGG